MKCFSAKKQQNMLESRQFLCKLLQTPVCAAPVQLLDCINITEEYGRRTKIDGMLFHGTSQVCMAEGITPIESEIPFFTRQYNACNRI